MQTQQPADQPETRPSSGRRARPKIFISYRRSDSAAITYRIFERLAERFGRESIFIDVDNIPYGTDFRAHIKSILNECSVVLVVIGPRWLAERDDKHSRIHDPDDPVRVEVLATMQGGTRLIPVVVEGAQMPSAAELPDPIKEMSYLNAALIDVGRNFQYDMDRLMSAIEGKAHDERAPARMPSTGAIAVPWGALGVIAGVPLVPIAAHLASLSPPWPPGVLYLTLAAMALATFGAMRMLRSTTPRNLRRLFVSAAAFVVVGGSVYLFALSSFTYLTPSTKERWAKGYVCTAEALLIYKQKCPNLGIDELRGAEFEAERLWTAQSVAVVRMGLLAVWLLIFAAFGLIAGGVAARQASGNPNDSG